MSDLFEQYLVQLESLIPESIEYRTRRQVHHRYTFEVRYKSESRRAGKVGGEWLIVRWPYSDSSQAFIYPSLTPPWVGKK